MLPVSAPAVIPERIGRLSDLAFDLSWSWHSHAREVFRKLDYVLWRLTSHNPVHIMQMVPPERLRQASHDSSFLRLYVAAALP